MIKVNFLPIISPLEEICICTYFSHISHMPIILIYVLENVEIVEKLMHTLLFTFRGSKGRFLSIEFNNTIIGQDTGSHPQ